MVQVYPETLEITADADLMDHQALPAGQGSSLIHDLPGAGELVQRLVEETVAAIKSARERLTIG